MSRVGKLPINIPNGIEVNIENLNVNIRGPKGLISKNFKGEIKIAKENNQILVTPLSKTKNALSMWGTARSIINGMVHGVTNEFSEELEINGVGYRAAVKDKYLNLTLGKSHNTKIEIPEGIKVEAPKQNIVILTSIDKQKLGQFRSILIKQRPPEPYKGKGIKKKGQYVQRKEGKKG